MTTIENLYVSMDQCFLVLLQQLISSGAHFIFMYEYFSIFEFYLITFDWVILHEFRRLLLITPIKVRQPTSPVIGFYILFTTIECIFADLFCLAELPPQFYSTKKLCVLFLLNAQR